MTDKWNGQGLPPVGEVCEFRKTNTDFRYDFVRVEVLFISDQLVVLQHSASKNHLSVLVDEVEFRPLKSEAERKRDEAVAEMVATGNAHTPWIKDVCAALHDAGYRKVNELTDEQINELAWRNASSENDELEKREFIATIQSRILGEES